MSNLINVTPQINPSGFEDIFVNSGLDDEYIFNRLKELKNIKNKFTQNNREILETIFNNYQDHLTQVQNDRDDFFVLDEYEKLEISKIKTNDHFIRYLVYRFKYKIFPKLKKIEEYPPCVQIEPASVCNLRCIMCYQSDKSFSTKKENMGFMDYELFKKIIDELEGKVEAITLASRGEPTLNKRFIEFLQYMKNKFLAVKINTNLNTLTEDMANAIFANDVQTLVISADASDKATYEKIRVKGKYEKLLKNTEMLYEIRKKYPESRCIIRVSGVKINDKQTLQSMKKIFGKFSDSVAFVNYLPWESSYENEKNNITEPCTDLWKRIFVWYDGKVNPCDYDYKSILSKHNYKDSFLKEIWSSDYYNNLRYEHMQKNRESIFPCNRCTNT